MNVVLSRMKRLLSKFNRHAYTMDDVLKICERERINIRFYSMNENVKGYYQNNRINKYRKKFIVLNEKLPEAEKLSVILHELAHHFLHVSMNTNRHTFYCRVAHLNDSKQDLEAEVVALIMQMPKTQLIELMDTPFDEISMLTSLTQDQLVTRAYILENHGE